MENWCIVPCAPEIKKVLDRCKYGYFHVYRKVRQLIRLKKMPPLFWTPKSVELIPIDYTLRCPVHIPDLIKTIKLNQKIRWIFKRFVSKWRSLKVVNEEDPITLEKPVQSIQIYDWNSRCIYTFEAVSLLNCIIDRLTYSSHMFINAKEPVNPLTNVPLTYGQLHFTTEALIKLGITNWILLALRSSKYCIQTLMKDYESRLQLYVIRTNIKSPPTESGKTCILQFIEDRYSDRNNSYYFRHIWEWAMDTIPSHPVIVRWIDLTLRYYMFLSGVEAIGTLYEDARILTYNSHDSILAEWTRLERTAILTMKKQLLPLIKAHTTQPDLNAILDTFLLTYSTKDIQSIIDGTLANVNIASEVARFTEPNPDESPLNIELEIAFMYL
jgi:hypothetical protein